MPKETFAPKLDRETNKLSQQIATGLASINRTLKTPPYTEIDPNKLVTHLVFTSDSLSDLQEKEKAKRPIRKLFPYYDELVALGVEPVNIERAYCRVSDDMPYDRDLLRAPSQLVVPRNFFTYFRNPTAGVSIVTTALDLLGAPKPRKIEKPELISFARNVLKNNVVENLSKKIIADSGLDHENPMFDHVKTKVYEDLDSEQTQFYFFGAQILGVMEGQEVDSCTFNTGSDLHQGIARLLAEPVIQTALPSLGYNRVETNVIMREFKDFNKDGLILLREATGINLRTDETSTESTHYETQENYKLLLSMYLNSQIPLLSIGKI